MKNLSEFRTALHALIVGNYTSQDVSLVVAQFSHETKRLLIHKEAQGWNIRGFSRNHQSEMDEISIDFIAALFARDERGIFIVLRNQLGSDLEQDDAQLFSAFQRLVFTHTQQEFIRLFQERDPIGKVLYRSLRYILTKHQTWEKVKSSHNIAIITEVSKDLPVLNETEIHHFLMQTDRFEDSLTGIMENLLKEVINSQKRAIPLNLLFHHLRVMVRQPLELRYQDTVDTDPTLSETIAQHITGTLTHIDVTLLNKYESTQKLTRDERHFFMNALQDILVAFANGGVDESYAVYLNRHSSFEISDGEYKRKYKKQFEYVAKTAKKDFSVRIRSDYKL
ncbi:hypothetical protein HQ531_14645 [bacterium]|nr:hypothetical protein [bacterium]